MKLKILEDKKRQMIAAGIFFVVWGFAIFQFGKMQAKKGSPTKQPSLSSLK